MGDTSTVPSMGDIHSGRKQNDRFSSMTPQAMSTFVKDLEDSANMNRNLVHQILIEKISAGFIPDCEELEVAVIKNRALEIEINAV